MAEDKCEQGTCICKPVGSDMVLKEGHAFCSPGCAAGEGCTHEECECAEHTA